MSLHVIDTRRLAGERHTYVAPADVDLEGVTAQVVDFLLLTLKERWMDQPKDDALAEVELVIWNAIKTANP